MVTKQNTENIEKKLIAKNTKCLSRDLWTIFD